MCSHVQSVWEQKASHRVVRTSLPLISHSAWELCSKNTTREVDRVKRTRYYTAGSVRTQQKRLQTNG